jgi:hypothetical protein
MHAQILLRYYYITNTTTPVPVSVAAPEPVAVAVAVAVAVQYSTCEGLIFICKQCLLWRPDVHINKKFEA